MKDMKNDEVKETVEVEGMKREKRGTETARNQARTHRD